MRRMGIVVVALLGSLVLAGCSGVPANATADEVTGYLEQRYGRAFEPAEDGERPSSGEDASVAYRFRDPANPDVVFEAGVRRERSDFPFLPPVAEPVFYDTFREAVTDWAVGRYASDLDLQVASEADVPPAAHRIYEAMGRINDALESEGFDVTSFTPAFEADVATPEGTRTVEFYQMNESVIASQLRDLL